MSSQKERGGIHAAAREAVSQQQLDRLRDGRRQPARELHFTPGNSVEHRVHARVDLERERMIRLISGRLDLKKDVARADFSKAKAGGKAKNDFERAR
jgi:hypothetical protein